MDLVTGGAGFVGSHLVEALLKKGRQVRVVDNFATGRIENLRGVIDKIDLLTGDVSDPTIAAAAVADIDTVFHQAALPSVPRSIHDPIGSHQNNVTATLQLLRAALDAGIRRFVYAASSSAYGDTPTLPKVESMPPRPRSPYAAAKLAGEFYCHAFYHAYGLETVCLRYFNVFGPRQDPNSPYAAVIPRFLQDLLEGRPPTVFGDGEQTRDFTYVDNVIEANLLAAEANKAAGEVFNVACGKRISLNRLLSILQTETGIRLAARHTAARRGDIRHSLADIRKAQTVLGYQPRIDTAEGLARTVAWYVESTGHRRAA